MPSDRRQPRPRTRTRKPAVLVVFGVAALLTLPLLTMAGCSDRDDGSDGGRESRRGEASRQDTTEIGAWFHEASAETGLTFTHETGPLGTFFFPEIMAGGVALLDYDRDGDLDVYCVNGNAERGGVDLSTEGPANRLFRQESDGRFVDVTEGSGLGDRGYGMGVAVGDVNNDGWPDVYLTNFGPDRLFLNRQDGSFADVTEASGIENLRWGASACFLDYDRDGWLDLYVTNYVDYFASRECLSTQGFPDYCSPEVFAFAADRLFRNRTGDLLEASEAAAGGGGAVGNPADGVEQPDADGTRREPRFEDVSFASRIGRRLGPGLGVAPGDFNEDGWPDLYVANDGSANYLWMNQRDGTFRDEAVLQGAAYDAQGRSQAGMGIACGDVDGDVRTDLLVTHLDGETNALYLARPGGGFRESSVEHGLGGPSYPYTGFGTALFDADHDGDLDLAVVNGRVIRPPASPPADARDAETYWADYAETNLLFVNGGDGDFSLASGDDPFLADPATSRALCVGDLDRDGDLDMIESRLGTTLRYYRREGELDGHAISIRVIDPRRGGRDMYGAQVRVTAGDASWARYVNPAGSYLSSHDPAVHVGIGDHERVDRIVVRWPDGMEESFAGIDAGSRMVLERGKGVPHEERGNP